VIVSYFCILIIFLVCDDTCVGCFGTATSCTACSGAYLFVEGETDNNCVISCSDGWYEDGSDCSLCASPCIYCDTADDDCLSCEDNTYLAPNSGTNFCFN